MSERELQAKKDELRNRVGYDTESNKPPSKALEYVTGLAVVVIAISVAIMIAIHWSQG